jgi:N-acetyl sugar amidotransferase
MAEESYRQCLRCVMDTTSDPEIDLDGNGFCNHCTGFFERAAKRTYSGEHSQRALGRLVQRIQRSGKDKAYDCVLGISGGVDSCYAAYIAKKVGLRPLAVHMDNGWDSTTAVKNIKNVARTLGIDYQSYVLQWEEFQDLQLAFLRASVPEIETPTDIAIPAALHRVAAEHGVRFIVSGGNYATEGIMPKRWHYNAKDVKYLTAVHDRFGKRKLKSFPTFGYQKEMYYKFIKGIRFVYLLNYVPYSRKDALRTLKEEVGWESYGGKHHESQITAFVHRYVLPKKFNIDYRRATLSTQICAGEVTRAEALEELATPPYDPATVDKDAEFVAKKLDISVTELKQIVEETPPRSYKDYPNEQRRLEFIYRIYRRLFGRS